ncbi:MGMT family protein (plasmid) [Pedobacter sp. BS3]|uniref:MGMT family protein n=1 Tax=Pedobacter sp. BS3 TaxID=2567937 RepID=UPI0011EC1E12|nr:MGMT family protein [Pedobacter sp. BS3]TZF85872.1 MGMT family protein [Pedobacter sp. BS3]
MEEMSFFEQVYEVVRLVPAGRVTSYGAIARYLGTKGSRMVGYAMNGCPGKIPPVPAHRVVNSKGILTGKRFFSTPTLMEQLLANEGIAVVNDRVQNFETIFWDPAIELTL